MPQLYLATGRSAGEELSSTYEGRHLTLEESYLYHPYHADGLVDKGDPVIIGDNLVGVALNSASAATDLISIDTEGIWFLNVYGCISDGTSDGIAKALVPGDPVYIELLTTSNATTRVCTLSGQSDLYHFRPFGFLLGNVDASVSTPTLVAVKVHNDFVPRDGGLDFGSGTTTDHQFLLEGSTTLRQSVAIRGTFEPMTILTAGEQIHAINFRMEETLSSTGGEITCAEFKVIRDDDSDAAVSAATALKLDVDNQNGGIAPYVRALDIMVEGAGTAPAVRSGIHFNSSGTPGSKEALIELESATVLGGVASDTLTTPSGAIAVNVGGTIHYLQLYST